MKKLIFTLLSVAMLATACQKNADELIASENEIRSSVPVGSSCGAIYETAFLAGQYYNVGSIKVYNDDVNLYVWYQTSGSYLMKKTHLFAGACSAIPVNNSGNPRIGHYPYKNDHGTGVNSFIVTIPLSSLPAGEICVSAHAEVVSYNAAGGVTFSQTGWGQGTQINDGGSWAMKFTYTPSPCNGNGGPGPR